MLNFPILWDNAVMCHERKREIISYGNLLQGGT